MQLVDDNVKIISLKKGDDYSVIDATGVVDYFGVEPYQVIDFLALVGDKSDNIPGIFGVSEEAAIKHIRGEKESKKIKEHINSDLSI
jgi:DNA polymerase-1